MTTTFLSFASIAKLHNNQLNSVSPIGELTNRARTFEKDPGVFAIDGTTDVVLYNFLSTKDGTPTDLPQTLAERQINIADWLYQQALAGNLNDNRFDCLNMLKTVFTNGVVFESVGEMVTNNAVWLPSVVRGYHLVVDADGNTDEQEFYLWFADAYFQEQYPNATYRVRHPVPLSDIDSLYEMNYQQLANRLDEETQDVINERERELTGDAPITEKVVLGFNVYDLINTPSFVKAYWAVLVNGNYNEDVAMEKLRNEILANSKYTEEQWGEKIPDIFNPNEVYGIVRFDRLGLLNRTDNSSTLSPIVDQDTSMIYVDQYLTPNMSSEHVIKFTQHIPALYKSMQYSMTPKVNNREGYLRMSDIIPDYQLIPSQDADFGRMDIKTRRYILQMENLLAAAEIVTEFSIPPAGVTTVVRFGKLWVTRKIENVKYMILTKYQMDLDGIVTGK